MLPEPDRVAVFREVYGRKVMHVEFEPTPDHSFEVDIAVKQLPGLDFLSIRRSPMRVTRPKELIGDGDDRLGLQIGNVAASWSQAGREETLEAGDAILLSNADPGSFTFPTSGVLTTLLVPRRAVSPLLRDVDSGLRCAIPNRAPAVRLLTKYLEVIQEDLVPNPGFQQLAVNHVYDLMALALGATRDAAELAKGRGVRAAHLHAIKQDIAANLDGELSLDGIAGRHGISPRYARMLFECEGTTFTEFVREQRLLLARRMLISRRFDHRRIGDIAYDAGFNDLSYFNRLFRRRFGLSPGGVRERALSGG
jgi:AraC-like DNA-binding protein